MIMYLKIFILLVSIYIFIGIVSATKWAISYDPTINSFPNNPVSFFLNTIFWFNRF